MENFLTPLILTFSVVAIIVCLFDSLHIIDNRMFKEKVIRVTINTLFIITAIIVLNSIEV